jgi:replication-associated recombination protein RarA
MAQRELFLFDVGQDRVADVTERRGQIVSGLMKAIRLQREEDAAYWMLALLRGGQDRAYLGRRCFGSACEDNQPPSH